MSLDLGDLGAFATAIGLVDAAGQPVPTWFSDPGRHLSRVLANPVQRAALVALVDELLGGSEGVTDDDGRSWLPLVEVDGETFRFFVTLQEGAGGAHVRIGAGVRVRVSADGVAAEVDAHVPLFVAAGTAPVPDPVLIGKAGAPVEASLRLRLPAGTSPGRVELAAAELTASVPTIASEPPTVRLGLRGLRLPGATAPRDVVVDATDIDELGDALLELVLGLVEAQVAALPATAPLRGLAAVLGLTDDAVPDFPVADLAARGPAALADWLAAALTGPAKADWLAGLATLLGGTVTDPGTAQAAVQVTVAGAAVRLDLLVTPAPAGRPVVVPRLSTGVTGGPGARLALAADLVALDLGSGTAVALPRLAVTGRLDPPGPGKLLPTVAGPGGLQVSVGALEVGVALDASRRPVLVVQAEDADVGATHYDVLDLSTPDALAAVAGQAVNDAAAALLAGLGAAGDAVAVLLGLTAPPAAPGVPRLQPGELLRDPVGAVRQRWHALVTTAAGDVPAVLAAARDALADDRVRGVAVTGAGTTADPWRLPLAPGVDLLVTAAGGTVTVAAAAAVEVADLAGTGAEAGLDVRLDLLRLDLATGAAAFLTGLSVRLAIAGPGGAALQLAAAGLAVSARALGAAVTWAPGAPVRVVPVLTGARLRLPGGEVGVPELVLAADGRLDLDAAAWRALERVAGALATDAAQRLALPWLAGLAELLGWAPAGGTGGSPLAGGAPRLDLAGLVADPRAALAAFAEGLTLDEAGLRALLDLLADALVGGVVAGRAAAARPWLLPLVAATGPLAGRAPADLPTVTVSLGTEGAAAPPSFVEPALRNWLPGDDGLEPDALAAALDRDAEIDDVLADLLAGRPGLAAGLSDLLDRWAGTDGLVGLPEEALPTGVTAHRPAELPHSAPLGGPDLAEVLAEVFAEHFGGRPATVVLVAVSGADRHGAPDVLTGPDVAALPPERVLDLSAPGLPPEAFLPPAAAAQPLWAVRLGTRAASRLPAGHPAGPDPDGITGQAARLRRVLEPLAGSGADVVVVAHGGAGHAALRAVAGLAGVRGVVTVGTPWTALTVDTLDAVPAGEALRLLAALLRVVDAAVADPADTAADPDEPDDADLALARAAVAALLDRDPYPDPLADLRPPGGLTAPAGVPVHAVVGSLSAPALRRALTATVAAALAARARARAAATGTGTANVTLRAGLRLPLDVPAGSGGLTARARIGLELAGLDVTGGPAATGPGVLVQLDLGAATGWLVGGPDPGRASGGARPLACRRLTAEVRLPVRSWGSALPPPPAHARIVLHEATAFGVLRDRWMLEAAGGGTSALLPEARAVLAEVTGRLGRAAAADPAVTALRDALTALGVLGADGGLDAVTAERLLLDPEPTVAATRDDPVRRARLATALRTLAGDARPAPGDTVELRYGAADQLRAVLDLASPAVTVAATADRGLPWRLGVSAAPAGVTGHLRLGPDVEAGEGPVGAALAVEASAAGLVAALLRRPPGRDLARTALWPAPTASAVLDALTAGLPGLVLGAAVDALRAALPGTSAAAAAAVDALLDAVGALGPVPATGPRPLRPLSDLLADPGGWLRSLPGGLTGTVPALLDATRGLLGLGGPAGGVQLADGVTLRAGAADGRLLVAVDVDAAAFTAPAGGLRLVLRGGAGLAIGTAPGGLRPLPELTVQLGVPGVGAVRLRVGPDAGGSGDAVGVSLVLAPQVRPEVVLLPGGPGLAGLADAAAAGAVAALPALLDALADNDPAGAPATAAEVAGRLVARLGDALALRTGTPPAFDAAALTAFGTDPAAALAARGAALAAAGLTALTEALGPLLGPAATRSVSTSDGALVVAVGALTLRWRPGTARVEAAVTLTGVAGVERVEAQLAVDPTGLALFDVALGPAPLNAGVLVLAPYGRVWVGSAPAGGRAIEVGLGLGVGTPAEQRLVARWDLAAGELRLLAASRGAGTDLLESTTPADVAAAAVGVLLDLAGGVVLAVPAVQATLGEAVLGTTVGDLLEGVLLAPGSADRLDPALAAELTDPGRLLRRLAVLAGNLAAAPDAAVPIGGRLTLRMTSRPDGATTVLGANLAIDGSWELNPGEDLVVSLEDDAAWITPPTGTVPAGLSVDVLALPATGPPVPRPALTVGGLGVRLARSSGPLLDAGVSLASVAVHLYAAIAPAGSSVSLAGGVRLELAGLGVALAGASGGDNAVAQGVLAQSGTGEDAPAPRFSPAVAVQKHAGAPLLVSLTAGPGSGPWWLTIQREFGPIYLEQVGLAVVNTPSGIESIGILVDGRISLLGLSASVDDLSLTYVVAAGGSALEPSRWRVDLAGFAVAADVGGVSLAGGLRRFTPSEGGVEYLGMLMARVAVYGLTMYGGYGVVGPVEDRYTSIFLFGAVNGPIGGPPAFFVTGIGGGFGINRRLSLPADLSRFGDFPLIKALDPAARAGDPFAELAAARAYFAPERGTFWFAAGLSFTSFALVDGVAVVAIQLGGGVEVSLLGLGRMALPRPQVALVSIEMALVARFSTREGGILVQAQLTDNSWLLAPAVRLTGGFAFASWLAGPNRGQVVVTMGGYHPDFHRDGYPVVPRLGLAWRIGDAISVTGESYFALTSEALMAGTRVEISARLGPGWAHAVFGADGIVFFDPFWLKVTVYASIDAGVTVDLWFAEVTISVHLSARVEVTGPPFRAVARFEVGPVGLTLAIGPSNTEPRYLAWDAFVAKYLEQAAPGRARVLAAVTGAGAVPPAGAADKGGDKSPDGTPDRPFRVVAEFELTVTSTVPLRGLVAGGPRRDLAASRVVSVAPMGLPGPADVLLTLRMVGPPSAAVDRIGRLEAVPQRLGAFPVGTWGVAQDASNPHVPAGDVISATDRVLLRALAEIPGTGPGEPPPPAIRYRQVETGRRRLNPLITEDTARRQVVQQATGQLAGLVPAAATPADRLVAAAGLLADRGGRSPADVTAWAADRAAAPLLGSLGEGLGRAPRAVTVTDVAPAPPPAPPAPRPPVVRALHAAPEAGTGWGRGLDRPTEPLAATTTVSARLLEGLEVTRLAPSSLAAVTTGLLAAVPGRLLQVPAAARVAADTVVAAVAPPPTVTPSAGASVAAGRTAEPATAERLAAFAAGLGGDGAVVAEGEVAVLELPDAERDGADARPRLRVRSGRARLVALGPAGAVLADEMLGDDARLVIPPATRGLVLVGLPDAAPEAGDRGLAGWVAGVPLPSATDGVLVAAGAVLDAVGRVPARGVTALRSGWVLPEELVGGESAVSTTFAAAPAAVAVVLEGGAGDDVALGVDGATRPTGPDGAPDPPLLVADGPRAVLVFRLAKARPGTTVTVTSGAARRVAGVVAVPVDGQDHETGGQAGRDPAETLAAAIGRLGVAALVPPPAQPGPGSARLSWEEA